MSDLQTLVKLQNDLENLDVVLYNLTQGRRSTTEENKNKNASYFGHHFESFQPNQDENNVKHHQSGEQTNSERHIKRGLPKENLLDQMNKEQRNVSSSKSPTKVVFVAKKDQRVVDNEEFQSSDQKTSMNEVASSLRMKQQNQQRFSIKRDSKDSPRKKFETVTMMENEDESKSSLKKDLEETYDSLKKNQRYKKERLTNKDFLDNSSGEIGGFGKKDKFVCSQCFKRLKHEANEYTIIEGSTEVPSIISQIQKDNYFASIKKTFKKETNFLREKLDIIKDEKMYLRKAFVKLAKIIIQTEMQSSSIDMRTIQSDSLTEKQIHELANQLEPDLLRKERMITTNSENPKLA